MSKFLLLLTFVIAIHFSFTQNSYAQGLEGKFNSMTEVGKAQVNAAAAEVARLSRSLKSIDVLKAAMLRGFLAKKIDLNSIVRVEYVGASEGGPTKTHYFNVKTKDETEHRTFAKLEPHRSVLRESISAASAIDFRNPNLSYEKILARGAQLALTIEEKGITADDLVRVTFDFNASADSQNYIFNVITVDHGDQVVTLRKLEY